MVFGVHIEGVGLKESSQTQWSFQMFYNCPQASGEHPPLQTHTFNIIKEEVKDKIKVTNADCSICSSDQWLCVCRTHNWILQINNTAYTKSVLPRVANLQTTVRWHHLLFTKGTDFVTASGRPTHLRVNWNSLVWSSAGRTAFFSVTTTLSGVDLFFLKKSGFPAVQVVATDANVHILKPLNQQASVQLCSLLLRLQLCCY